MLEVLLYATVSKLLEFVARRDSKGKQHHQVQREIRQIHAQKKNHEQVLKTIDNNVHSKIPNLMMGTHWVVREKEDKMQPGSCTPPKYHSAAALRQKIPRYWLGGLLV